MKKKLTSLLTAALLGGAVPALPAQAPIAGALGLSSVNSLTSNQAGPADVNTDPAGPARVQFPFVWPFQCWGEFAAGTHGSWFEYVGIDVRSCSLTFVVSPRSIVATGLVLLPTAPAPPQIGAVRAFDNGGDSDLSGRVVVVSYLPMPLCSAKPTGLAAPNTGLDVGTIFNVSMQADIATPASISLLSVSSEPQPTAPCEPPTCPIDCTGNVARPAGYFSASAGVYFLSASSLPGERVITAPTVSVGYTAEDGSGVRANWFGYSSSQQVEVNPATKTR